MSTIEVSKARPLTKDSYKPYSVFAFDSFENLKLPLMEDPKINIFVSYCHDDDHIKDLFDRHIITLKLSNKVNLWTDSEIDRKSVV